MPGTQTVAVCMTLKSLGPQGDRLLSATTPLASKVDVWRESAGGSSADTRTPTTLDVAGGRRLEMSMSGDRLVLYGVDKALWAYDTFPMTLIFERAGRVEIDVMVEEAPAIQGDRGAER